MKRLSDTYIQENLMGPNAIRMLDELLQKCKAELDQIKPACICDLGCGTGLTSMALADLFPDAHIWACDLWVSEEENRTRFENLGFADQITAVNGDALALPFEEGFFDAIISVDSYHYFGHDEGVIDQVARMVKQGGVLALAFPGFIRPLDDAMVEVLGRSWSREDMEFIWSADQWRELWAMSSSVRLELLSEMECFDAAWDDWLACDNEYAKGDAAAMNSGGREIMNLLGAVLIRE